MGNYSWLRASRNAPEICRINWSAMDTTKLFKHWILQDCYEAKDEERPSTLADMAKRWDDTKFCGYFTNEYIEALGEFTRCLMPYNSFPRLYYENEGWDELWCLEFHPGTTTILISRYSYTTDLKYAMLKYSSLGEESIEYYDRKCEAKDKIWEESPDKEGWSEWFKLAPSYPTREEEYAILMGLLGKIYT